MDKYFHWIFVSWLTLGAVSCTRRSAVSQGPAGTLAAHTGGTARSGEAIYRQECARCHGSRGEGVADKYDEPLYGEKSVEALAKYIARTMPEDRKVKCSAPDAQLVAEYIHGAFYSTAARDRSVSNRLDLVRLTNRQFQESVADLIGGFQPIARATNTGGLRGEYFQSKGMNKKDKHATNRLDRFIQFDFGEGSPLPEIAPDQFSIAWSGSLFAPDTGFYEFKITTPNGARLYLNSELAAGDTNRRDDSDAKREATQIDLWVSSGGMLREGSFRQYLLAGRTYPLRLDYFKFKEKNASVKLEWRPPHGNWQVVPPDVLSPEPSTRVAVVSTEFPPDDGSLGYERGSAISKSWDEAVTRAAAEMAGLIESRLNRLAGISDQASNHVDSARTDAVRTFALQFVTWAFRRPLDAETRELYVDRHFTGNAPPETAIKRIALLTLKSPRFLYPELLKLNDDYTVASRLALNLWDSVPDRELLENAAAGRLRDPAHVRIEADRMMRDPRARTKLTEFFRHWLAIEEGEEISKDPKTFPGFDSSMVADLRTSLERFVDEVVWSEKSDYRELLLADYLYVNRRLAQYYGTRAPEGDDFARIPLDPKQRAGVFTHPFLLSVFSYHKSTSPIHRGVFLTRNVMGRFLKPPPMAIEFMDDRFDPSMTMREKVTELTAKPTCMGCHSTINPLGFSLENYDATGRFRTVDNQKPVDPVAEYGTVDGRIIRLSGPRDLAEHAASDPNARRGFVRQLFQYTIKQSPVAFGEGTLESLENDFSKSGHHIRGLHARMAVRTAMHGLPATSQLTAQR